MGWLIGATLDHDTFGHENRYLHLSSDGQLLTSCNYRDLTRHNETEATISEMNGYFVLTSVPEAVSLQFILVPNTRV